MKGRSPVIMSFEDWGNGVSVVTVPSILFRVNGYVGQIVLFLRSVALLRRGDVFICNGSGPIADKLLCLFSYFFRSFGVKIILFDPFATGNGSVKKWINRRIIWGAGRVIIWSAAGRDRMCAHLGVGCDNVFVIPYKSNHSKKSPLIVPQGRFIFSGGNSSRDYSTLFEAVKCLDILVVVSVTDMHLLKGLSPPGNTVIVSAREPYFGMLMASCLFFVLPLKKCLVRSAGEASVCNAMWHGKAVIACDDISLGEYIEDGKNGYIVAPGNVEALRGRICELLNDENKCARFGISAHESVCEKFTHEMFINRILCLAVELRDDIGE